MLNLPLGFYHEAFLLATVNDGLSERECRGGTVVARELEFRRYVEALGRGLYDSYCL